MSSSDIGVRIKEYRTARGLSMRSLAKKAGVTASYISGIEAGRISPTITNLRKLLVAMDSDLGSFFNQQTEHVEEFIFRRANARILEDEKRRYAFLLPKRKDLQMELVEELIEFGETPEFESLASDMAGVVMNGLLAFEIQGEPKQMLEEGDSFYVPSGIPVRGTSADSAKPVRILTIYTPPRY